jgi:CspA family cold shock protein
MTGKVLRLVRDKGFGFIKDGSGKEYFFHRSSVRNDGFDTLNEGENVEFDEEASQKGPRATNINPRQ